MSQLDTQDPRTQVPRPPHPPQERTLAAASVHLAGPASSDTPGSTLTVAGATGVAV